MTEWSKQIFYTFDKVIPTTNKKYFDIKTSRFFLIPHTLKLLDWWFILRQEIGAHGCSCLICKLLFFKGKNSEKRKNQYRGISILKRNYLAIQKLINARSLEQFPNDFSNFICFHAIDYMDIAAVCKYRTNWTFGLIYCRGF